MLEALGAKAMASPCALDTTLMERKKLQMNEGLPISVDPLLGGDGLLESLLAHPGLPRAWEPCIAACIRV